MHIRVANHKDKKQIKSLLYERDKNKNFAFISLFLNNQKNGFTLLVEMKNELVALSTFSKRSLKLKNKKIRRYLYWENLFVKKRFRNGMAYLKIFFYIKEKINLGEFDGVYTASHRKGVPELHKSAGFKVISQLDLCLKKAFFSLQIYENNKDEDLITNLSDISEKKLIQLCKIMNKNHNTDNLLVQWSKETLARQLFYNNGRKTVILHEKNSIFIFRIIKVAPLLNIIFLLYGNSSIEHAVKKLKSNLSFGCYFVVLSENANQNKKSHFKIRTYNLLSLKKGNNTDAIEFNFLEHDAI